MGNNDSHESIASLARVVTAVALVSMLVSRLGDWAAGMPTSAANTVVLALGIVVAVLALVGILVLWWQRSSMGSIVFDIGKTHANTLPAIGGLLLVVFDVFENVELVLSWQEMPAIVLVFARLLAGIYFMFIGFSNSKLTDVGFYHLARMTKWEDIVRYQWSNRVLEIETTGSPFARKKRIALSESQKAGVERLLPMYVHTAG